MIKITKISKAVAVVLGTSFMGSSAIFTSATAAVLNFDTGAQYCQ